MAKRCSSDPTMGSPVHKRYGMKFSKKGLKNLANLDFNLYVGCLWYIK